MLSSGLSYYSVPTGRVIFEIGGVPVREELARDSAYYHLSMYCIADTWPVLRQAASKLPTKMEFISRTTPPRLGNLVLHPPKPPLTNPIVIPESSAPSSSATLPL